MQLPPDIAKVPLLFTGSFFSASHQTSNPSGVKVPLLITFYLELLFELTAKISLHAASSWQSHQSSTAIYWQFLFDALLSLPHHRFLKSIETDFISRSSMGPPHLFYGINKRYGYLCLFREVRVHILKVWGEDEMSSVQWSWWSRFQFL